MSDYYSINEFKIKLNNLIGSCIKVLLSSNYEDKIGILISVGNYTITILNTGGFNEVIDLLSVIDFEIVPLAYVVNSSDNTISVINTLNNSVLGLPIALPNLTQYSLNPKPQSILITPTGILAYVTSEDHNLYKLNLQQKNIQASYTFGYSLNPIVIDKSGNLMYIGGKKIDSSGTIDKFDTRPYYSYNPYRTSLNSAPEHMGVAVVRSSSGWWWSDYNYIYVTLPMENKIAELYDTNHSIEEKRSICIQDSPYGIAITKDNSKLYVTCNSSNVVKVINRVSMTVINTITVGSNPSGIVISENGSMAFVANTGSNTVSAINLGNDTVVATYNLGEGSLPKNLAIAPNDRAVYIACSGDNTVKVINLYNASINDVNYLSDGYIYSINVGKNPNDIAITPVII